MTGAPRPAARQFAEDLHRLYEAAGSPQYRILVHQGGQQRPPVTLSVSSLSDWLSGRSVPSNPAVVHFLVTVLADRAARRCGHRAAPVQDWLQLQRQARAIRRGGRPARSGNGTVVGDPEELPAELAGLLRQMHRYAEELPYSQAGDYRRALSSVYVRQSVASPVEARRVWDPDLDEAAMVEEDRRVTRLAQPFDDIFGQYDHLVVEGAAGLGKSTLGRFLVGDLVAALLDGPRTDRVADLVPIMLPARVLAVRADPDRTWGQTLQAAVTAEYGLLGDGVATAETFLHPVGGRRWLVIIDALDEIPDPADRDRLLKALSARMGAPGPARFLVTSRPLVPGEIAQLQGPRVGFFELQPFDETALELFAERHFNPKETAAGAAEAAEFLAQVRRAGLAQVLSVPLLATVAAKVFTTRRRSQPLPSSRYELYREYIAHFATARDNSAAEVFAATGDDRLCAWLDEHRDALLEHLAVQYTRSEAPLSEVAADYLRESAPLPGGPPPGWDTMVGDWLARTGLLGWHGMRLRFRHQTFAEHLAATARARALPPIFDSTDPEWAELVTRFLLDDEAAEQTLVHCLHLPGGGHGLLTHLQERSQSEREHAGTLIEQGVPCSQAELDAYLSLVEGKIFAASSLDLRDMAGLIRHPVVRDRSQRWLRNARVPARVKASLVDILRDGNPRIRQEGAVVLAAVLADSGQPAETRSAAAEVLARLGAPYADRAVAALRQIALDPALPGGDRSSAAEALAAMGGGYRAEAAELLLAIATDPLVGRWERRMAAVELAKLGSENRARAADLLYGFAVDPQYDAGDRRWAAESLAALGGEQRPRAIAALQRAAVGLGAEDNPERLLAMASAALLERDGRERAADLLRQVVVDPGADEASRQSAAVELAGLGGEHRAYAAEILHDLAIKPMVYRHYLRDTAAQKLAALGVRHRELTADAFTRIAADPALTAVSRFRAARELARLDAEPRARAARILVDIAAAASAPLVTRADAALEVAKLDDAHRHRVATMFSAAIADPRGTPGTRILGAAVLTALRPTSDAAPADELYHLAVTAGGHHEARMLAANTLADLGGEYVDRAADLLLAAATDPTSDPSGREAAAGRLAELGDTYRDRAAGVLRTWAGIAVLGTYERLSLLLSLAPLGDSHRTEAVDMLTAMMADPWTGNLNLSWLVWRLHDLAPTLVTRVAEWAAELADDPFREPARLDRDDVAILDPARPGLAVALYDRLQRDPELPPLNRCAAAADLIAVDEGYRDRAVATLREVAGGMVVSDPGHRLLVAAAESLDTDDRAAFATALAAVVDDPVTLPELRIAAASRLADGGPAHRVRVLTAYRRAAADPRLSVGHLLNITYKLDSLAPDLAAHLLGAVLADSGMDADSAWMRRHAAVLLAGLGPAHRTTSTVALTAMVTAPLAASDERIDAAVALCRLGAEHTATAATALTGVLTDPTMPVAERVRAGRELAGLGTTHAAVAFAAAETLLADEDASFADRATGAALLAWLRPDTRTLCRQMLTRLAADARDGTRLPIVALLVAAGGSGRAVARVLARLVADPAEDDRDRYTAAERWMLLAGADLTRAAVALGGLVTDPTIAADVRTEAAVMHGRVNPAAREQAVETLLQVATDSTVTCADRLKAYRRLGRVEPMRRGWIAAALHEIVEDPTTAVTDRLRVAADVSGYGEQDRRRAGAALAGIAADRNAPAWVRRMSARGLLDVGTGSRSEAAALLREITADVTVEGRDRALALADLADIDPGETGAAVAALHIVATDAGADPADRLQAAERLFWLGGEHGGPAARVCASVAADPAVPGADRREAATGLFDHGPAYHLEAADLLVQLATDDTVAPGECLLAVRRLASFEPYADRIPALLRGLLHRPDLGISDRCEVATALAGCGSTARADAVQVLGDFLDRPGTDDTDRLPVLDAMCRLGPAGRRDATGRLRDMSEDRPLHRGLAAATLAGIDGGDDEHAASLLTAVAGDPGMSVTGERLVAVAALMRLGAAGDTVAGLLRPMVAEADVRVWERLRAAQVLARLGAAHRAGAIDLIAGLSRTPDADPWEVADCAVARAMLDVRHRAESVRLLSGLAHNDSTSADPSRYAADLLLSCGPAARETAADALARLAGNPRAWPAERRGAAATLITLGGRHAPRGVAILRELAIGADQCTFDRAMAYAVLAPVSNDRPVAVEALRRVADDPAESPEHRRRTSQWLTSLGVPARRHGIGVLRTLAQDSDVAADERALAAAALATYDATHRTNAIAALEHLVIGALTPDRQLLVAVELGTAVPGHREAGEVLRRIATDPDGTPRHRHEAVGALALVRPTRAVGGPAVSTLPA